MNPHFTQKPDFGALVISLDFELHWGVRDKSAPDGPYRENLLGARKAIPRILDLFEEFDVAATWATVGFLFAESRREREEFSPVVRPQYTDTKTLARAKAAARKATTAARAKTPARARAGAGPTARRNLPNSQFTMRLLLS
jgi:hypothetical protein